MTEQEKLHHAKHYIDSLANGGESTGWNTDSRTGHRE